MGDPVDPSTLHAENIHAAAQQGSVAVGAVQVAGNVDQLHIGDKVTLETLTLRATPPAPPPHFAGREDDLAKFTQLLTSGQNVAITALQGMGGIGKTALAQKLAEHLCRGDPSGRPYFPGGVLWWTRPIRRCLHRARRVGDCFGQSVTLFNTAGCSIRWAVLLKPYNTLNRMWRWMKPWVILIWQAIAPN